MDILTILKIAGAILGTATISAAGIWWFVQLGANTLADAYKKKIDHEFGKKLESYKSQLEVLKASTLKYRDKQFELYLDLWKNLQDLQFATTDLWASATLSNLKRFETALKTTHHQVETTSILLEDNHYRELIDIILLLQEFDNGKEKLIAAKRARASVEEINRIIDFNRQRMTKCLSIIKSMKISIKNTIKGEELITEII